MKNIRSQSIAIFVSAAMLWSMAFSCSSAITQLQKYVPIGIMAFDGAVNIISPALGSPLQMDKALVDGTWATVNAAITAYQSAPAADKQTKLGEVITALNAVEAGIGKTLTDFGASGVVDEAVQAALVLINATLSAIEAQLQPAPTPIAGKKAAAAPRTMTVKGKPIVITGKPSDFKRTFNQIMVVGGHADRQLQ